MGILETVKLPIHVWLYSKMEILFHLVNLRGLYYYFWSRFHWLDRLISTQTEMGPCQKCWYSRCWVSKECSCVATGVEHTSQHLATLLWVSVFSKSFALSILPSAQIIHVHVFWQLARTIGVSIPTMMSALWPRMNLLFENSCPRVILWFTVWAITIEMLFVGDLPAVEAN